jgi:hypothetical protein
MSLSNPSDNKPGAEKRQNPFGGTMMAFTSAEDMMKKSTREVCKL